MQTQITAVNLLLIWIICKTHQYLFIYSIFHRFCFPLKYTYLFYNIWAVANLGLFTTKSSRDTKHLSAKMMCRLEHFYEFDTQTMKIPEKYLNSLKLAKQLCNKFKSLKLFLKLSTWASIYVSTKTIIINTQAFV